MNSKQYYCKLDTIKLAMDAANDALRSTLARVEGGKYDEVSGEVIKSANVTLAAGLRKLKEYLNIEIEEIKYEEND